MTSNRRQYSESSARTVIDRSRAARNAAHYVAHERTALRLRRHAVVTLKRIRAYPLLIGLVVWTMWAVDMSRPGPIDRVGKLKGTDFLQFYVGGSFAREGRLAEYYDVRAMHARAEALVPASRDTIYIPVQSPQTALLFAQFAALPYVPAVFLWFAAIAAIYAACCWWLWRRCAALHSYRREVVAAAIAFPGLYSTILNGQLSVLSLAAVTAAVVALERDRRVAAGLALGCLAFKPHWCAVAIAIFVAAREWRVAAAAAASAAAQMGIAIAAGGSAAMVGYMRILISLGRIGDLVEPRAGDSLRGLFRALVPMEMASLALYVVASAAAIVVAARVWRSETPFALRMSAMIVTTILVSPHAFGYDLILLAPVFLLLADWFAAAGAAAAVAPWTAGRAIAWSLAALFIAPLLTALPDAIRLQASVTAMAVLLAAAHRVRRPYRSAPETPPRARAPQSPAAAAA